MKKERFSWSKKRLRVFLTERVILALRVPARWMETARTLEVKGSQSTTH